jgi:hypothetical protein
LSSENGLRFVSRTRLFLQFGAWRNDLAASDKLMPPASTGIIPPQIAAHRKLRPAQNGKEMAEVA